MNSSGLIAFGCIEKIIVVSSYFMTTLMFFLKWVGVLDVSFFVVFLPVIIYYMSVLLILAVVTVIAFVESFLS